jgi:hypothetical protein
MFLGSMESRAAMESVKSVLLLEKSHLACMCLMVGWGSGGGAMNVMNLPYWILESRTLQTQESHSPSA